MASGEVVAINAPPMFGFRLPPVLRLGPDRLRRLRRHLAAADRAMAARDWWSAEAAYAAALALDPTPWPIIVQWGHALKEQGRLLQAETAYRQALRLRPEAADTHLQLGHVLKLQGRLDDAVAAYTLSYRLSPSAAGLSELSGLGVPEPLPRDARSLALSGVRASGRPSPSARPPADERFIAQVYGTEPPGPGTPRSLLELLSTAGLTAGLLPWFDEAFYVAYNPSVRREVPEPDRLRCLAHFCRIGVGRLLPFHSLKIFDPAFYCAVALDGHAVAPEAAYRHWLTLGLARHEPANRTDFLHLRCGIGPRVAAMLPEVVQMALFTCERQGGSWSMLFDDLLDQGAFADGATRAPLLDAFADRAERFAASDVEAERVAGAALADRIHALAPDHSRATRITAGLLRRAGANEDAARLYELLDRSPARSAEVLLGLAACLDHLGRLDAALDALASGRLDFAGDVRIDRAFESAAGAVLARAIRRAETIRAGDPAEQAAAQLGRAIEGIAARMETREPLPRQPIRSIAILAGRATGPGRLVALTKAITTPGYAAAVFDTDEALALFLDGMHRFEAVIVCAMPASYALIRTVTSARAVGLLTVYDLDDDGERLRAGGIDGTLIKAAMRLCDVGLAASPAIASRMAPLMRSGRAVGDPATLVVEAARHPPAPPPDERPAQPSEARHRPKLLIVNVYYPPQRIGGATRVVHDNVRDLLTDGRFDIEVFTTAEGGGQAYRLSSFAQDGVRVTAATIPKQDHVDRVLDLPGMGEAFATYLASARPDLIHFHCIQRLTIATVEAARAAGIPYIVTVHDGWWVSEEQFIVDRFGRPALYDYGDPEGTRRRLGPEAGLRMARLAPSLRGAASVLAVSNAFAALHRGCGVPDVLAVANGLSGDLGPPRRTPGDGAIRLGFTAGLHAHKGWGLIEQVLGTSAFGGFQLTAVDHEISVGDSRSSRIGATPVHFVPRVPFEAIGALYAEIDVVLAPSIWPESYGLVTREALALGCWVVASDRGAIGEDVIEGKNGFVIDVGSPKGLAAALATIARSPTRYRDPPAFRAPLRSARQQARDLAVLYRRILAEGR